MIPKKIHYCWLSRDKMPENIINCMTTWKKVMPEYEVIHWGMEKFDITSISFVEEACSKKKWAFAADYIRLYALYMEGGIYLDSDVTIKKSLNDFLENDFFTSLEYHPHIIVEQNTLSLLHNDGSSKIKNTRKPGIGIQAAILGSVKGHPFLKDCLDWYSNKHFIQDDSSLFNKIIAPDIYAMVAEDYGFKYADIRQELKKNILILPSEYFAAKHSYVTEKTYAIHEGAGSWREEPETNVVKSLLKKIRRSFLKS
jgi:mannosyltransferase OCH1-like enzyme